MAKTELESKFSFTYIATSATPHGYNCVYECKNFDEFLQKTSLNPFLKLEGVGSALLPEDTKESIPLKCYINNPPPFDVKKLDLANNLAHVWLYQAYFLDPNALLPRRPKEKPQAETIGIVDDLFIKRDKEYQMMSRTLSDIFPRGIDAIIADYSSTSENHTRFINGLIQLYFYICENTGRGRPFNLCDYRCDRTAFSPTGFAFEPLTYLFYCTQKTGFTTYSLSTYCSFSEIFCSDIQRYKNISEREEIKISFKRSVYAHEIATSTSGECLERNKQLIK